MAINSINILYENEKLIELNAIYFANSQQQQQQQQQKRNKKINASKNLNKRNAMNEIATVECEWYVPSVIGWMGCDAMGWYGSSVTDRQTAATHCTLCCMVFQVHVELWTCKIIYVYTLIIFLEWLTLGPFLRMIAYFLMVLVQE